MPDSSSSFHNISWSEELDIIEHYSEGLTVGIHNDWRLTPRSLVHALAKEFVPAQQTWRIIRERSLHLAITIVSIALLVMILALFEKYGNVSQKHTRWFDAVTTVLNLALGINFLETFKGLARVLRWRVLASKSFTIREADLILGCESLLKVVTLMWESPKKPLVILMCTSWLIINLLAQASIAILSLYYSMESGRNASGTYIRDGIVNAAKLDSYFEDSIYPNGPAAQMTNAHTYGELVRGQQCCQYEDDFDIKHANQTCPYFCKVDGLEFAYRYVEYSPLDAAQGYPYLTYRNIRASAGQCYQYSVDWPNSPFIDSTDGPDTVQVLAFYNDTFTGDLPVPRFDAGVNGTTYVYNGTSSPQDKAEIACGPRCLWMYVFRLGKTLPDGLFDAQIFSCPITISEVYNATEDWHQVSDSNARLAAAAIALSGRYTIPQKNGPRVWQQYQLYSWGSYWETYQMDAQQIGARIAEFAMGSLAAMANLNPKQQVPGTLPILGYRLYVQWPYIIALAACIGGTHCLLVGLMLWLARPIVVPEDSNLCTAALLHGLVGKLDDRGSIMSGKEMAEKIQTTMSKGKGKVKYGVSSRSGRNGELVFEVSENVQTRKEEK